MTGVAIVPPEDHLCPSAHSSGCIPPPEKPELLTRNRVNQHTFVPRAAEFRRREQLVPGAQPADVVILLGSVVQLEKGRRTPSYHRADQSERERVRNATNRMPEMAS